MACASSVVTPFHVVDLKDKDFFKSYNLKVQGIIGEGSAATVYLVKTDNDSGELMAVKTYSLSDQYKARSERQFTAEVKCMQAVSHPHLMQCYKAVQCKKYLALAMPYYPGGDLTELWGSTDIQQIQSYILDVAQALEHLHQHNIAHMDIKLDNVFLDESGHAYLGDMGLAKEMSGDIKTIAAEWVGGTMDYWAPEVYSAEYDDMIDPFKLDVYALGVTFFILVSGVHPAVNVDYQSKLKAIPVIKGLKPSQRLALELMLDPQPTKRPTASEVVKMLTTCNTNLQLV